MIHTFSSVCYKYFVVGQVCTHISTHTSLVPAILKAWKEQPPYPLLSGVGLRNEENNPNLHHSKAQREKDVSFSWTLVFPGLCFKFHDLFPSLSTCNLINVAILATNPRLSLPPTGKNANSLSLLTPCLLVIKKGIVSQAYYTDQPISDQSHFQ